MRDDPLPSLKLRVGIIAAIIVCVLSVQICLYLVVGAYIPSWPERGQFGDLFGAANAFFSGIAFAGVAYAILLQQQQLKTQAQEAVSAREEARELATSHEKTVYLGLASLLVEHYRRRLTEIESASYTGASAAAAENERQGLKEKLRTLETALRDTHNDVITGLGK